MRRFLSGIDYFQLLIDKHAKRKGGVGHIVRLKLTLEGHLPQQMLQDKIHHNSSLQKIARTRVSTNFGFGYPYLYFTKKDCGIPIHWHEYHKKNDDTFLNIALNPFEAPPLRIDAYHTTANATILIFSFHHILFDHIGIQEVLRCIDSGKEVCLVPPKHNKIPFLKRAHAFFQAINFAFKHGTTKMSSLQKKLPPDRPLKANFHETAFTVAEGNQILDQINKNDAQHTPSLYFIEQVAKSFHSNIFKKQHEHDFFWIPVPVNDRLKTKDNYLLTNGLTFLFYKLSKEALNQKASAIPMLQKQMKEQIKKRLPKAFLSFADGWWYFPLPIYYLQWQLPSWGKLSSFSVSYLGTTLPEMQTFLGHEITDLTHYPSNVVRPGLTVIFYYFKGTLRVVTGFVRNDFTAKEENQIMQDLKNRLLGNAK